MPKSQLAKELATQLVVRVPVMKPGWRAKGLKVVTTNKHMESFMMQATGDKASHACYKFSTSGTWSECVVAKNLSPESKEKTAGTCASCWFGSTREVVCSFDPSWKPKSGTFGHDLFRGSVLT